MITSSNRSKKKTVIDLVQLDFNDRNMHSVVKDGHWEALRDPGMLGLGLKWVRLARNGTKMCFLKIIFSAFCELNCAEKYLQKSHIICPI